MNTLRKALSWITFFLVAALILGFLMEIVNRGTAAASSVYDEFYPIIKKINRSAPIMAEPGVRLDGASIDRSTGIRYRYTLTELYPEQFDPQTALQNRSKMREQVARDSCNHPDMAPAIRAGVTFVHDYHDAHGERYVTITVDQRTCERAGYM